MKTLFAMIRKASHPILVLLFSLIWLVGSAYAAPGTAGTGGSAGSNGTNGGNGTSASANFDGGGGGGGGGGGTGGTGGNGAGGGVVLSSTTTMTVSGTIDDRGGGSSTTNGGTVKLFYGTGSAPSTSGVSSGRTYSSNQAVLSVPTLNSPNTSAASSISAQFSLRSSSLNSDYLQYYIELYDASSCGGSLILTADQTSSQTNWINQDANSSTAYVGNMTLSNSTLAVYNYLTALSNSHTYSWRAKAIDPAGSNTYSSFSGCQDFTIQSGQVKINGGVKFRGGSSIK